jgi:hypothetical protein
MTLDRDAMFVRSDRSRRAVDVILDEGAQRNLAPTWNRPPPDFSEVFVLLGEAGDGGKHVEVYINEERIGTLTPTDSAEFLTNLAAAKADSMPVVAEAARDRDADGRWALHIYRPEQP